MSGRPTEQNCSSYVMAATRRRDLGEGSEAVAGQASALEHGLHLGDTTGQFLLHVNVALVHTEHSPVTRGCHDLQLRELVFRMMTTRRRDSVFPPDLSGYLSARIPTAGRP